VGRTSARPDALDGYADAGDDMTAELATLLETLVDEYATYASRPSDHPVDASGPLEALGAWARANADDDAWVRAVAAAFRHLDAQGLLDGAGGVDESTLSDLLAANGVTTPDRSALTVEAAVLHGMPPTSGYAIDPVCTANGNFVEVEVDLELPVPGGRLRLERTYNSRRAALAPGGFGPGWSSWDDAHVRVGDGGVLVHLPDGREAWFATTGGDGFARVAGIPAELVAADDGHELRWFGGATWRFGPDGRAATMVDRHGGRTDLERDDAGRLLALRHDAGAVIELRWDTDRIVAATGSDGRTTTYRYADGSLVQVERDHDGGMRYELADGRIVAVRDADDVELLRNTYDRDGRVTSQRGPHGRVATLTYRRGVTEVGDDEDGPRSVHLHDANGRLIGLVDDHGHRMAKVYDLHGNPVVTTDREGRVTRQWFDARDRLVRRVHPDGGTETFTYDRLDRLVRETGPDGEVVRRYAGDAPTPVEVTDATGATLTVELDVHGLARRLTDADGVTITHERDARGQLVAVANTLDEVERYQRDDHGDVVAVRYADGRQLRIDRDAAGRATARRDDDGATWTYVWSAAGRLLAVTEPNGARTELRRGPHGDVVAVVDALGATTTLEHDPLGNVERVVAADGAKFTFTHDGLGRLVAATDPEGSTWLREHDADGRLVALVDPDGGRGERELDTRGRPVVERSPLGAERRTVRDAAGRVVGVEAPDGARTVVTRDAVGRVTAVEDPTGAVTRYGYTAAGRLASVTAADGSWRSYEYDAAGRLVAEVRDGHRLERRLDAAGHLVGVRGPVVDGEVRLERDPRGHVTAIVDAAGGRTEVVRDHAGRPLEVRAPSGATRRLDHDARGHLVGAVDALGHRTTWERDVRGRPVAVTDALGGVTRLERDSRGRLVAATTPTGARTEVTWTPGGRLAAVAAPGVSGRRLRYDGDGRLVGVEPDTGPAVRYDLDRVGRITGVDDGRTTLRIGYDARGRLTSVTGPDGRRTTDRLGRELVRTDVDGTVTRTVLDPAGRPVAVSDPQLGEVDIVRDAAGRPVEVTASGLTRRWRWEAGRLRGFVQTTAAGELEVDLDRDVDGRVTRVTAGDRVRTVGRDAAGQVREVVDRAGDAEVRTWRYAYDDLGRCTREDGPRGTRRFTYDGASRLVRVDGPDGSVAVDHDGAGRRTAERDGHDRTYGWGPAGHLDRLAVGHDDLDLEHDATGLPVQVGGAPVGWWSDGVAPQLARVGDARLVGPTDARAALPVDGGVTTWLLPPEVGRLLAEDPFDPGRTAGTGVPEGRGAVVGGDGHLRVAGLTWLGARTYDGWSHRFLSVDPLAAVPGDPVVADPYHLAVNDPFGLVDPLGLRPLSDEDFRELEAAANRGAFESGWDWAGDVWDEWGEEITAGLVVAAGVGLLFVPGGQAVGAGILVSSATSIGTQYLLDGEVAWDQVAMSGVIGGFSGGVGGVATGAASNALRTTALQGWQQTVTATAIGGGASGLTGSGLTQAVEGEFDPARLAVDTLSGATFGGLGGMFPASQQAFGFDVTPDARQLQELTGAIGGFHHELTSGMVERGVHPVQHGGSPFWPAVYP
jgi:RHS repeat-associated protein